MSDEPQSGAPAAEQETRGPRAGARLKEARQARSIPLEDIAEELHIDVAKLRDLEENRFDGFSAPVFTRGYLRKYASLVDLPETEILGEYDEITGAGDTPPVVVKASATRRRLLPSPQSLAIVVLILVVGVLGWWAFSGSALKPVRQAAETGSAEREPSSRPAPAAAQSRATAAPAVAETETLSAPPDTAAPAVTSGEGEAEAAAEAATEGAAAADPQTSAPPAAAAEAEDETGDVSLVMRFTGECWLEVSDGDGRRLTAGIALPGQTRRFTATPPVSVVLGNADVASIEIDGEAYTIGAGDRRGRTARFTVGAQ